MKIEFNSCGKKLVGILEEGDKKKPSVILCHGYSSNKDRLHYENYAAELKRKGISSLRFDFYGHGESEGSIEEFDFEKGKQNIIDAIGYLKGEGFSNFIVSGSSFMGVCAVMAAEGNKDIIALTLLSPGSGSRDYEFIFDIASRVEQPAYLIHGDKDDCVPVEKGKRLAEALQNCELDIIKGADHTFTGMKELRQRKVAEFVERIL